MPVQYKLDTARDLALAHAQGRLTADEIIEAFGDEIAVTAGGALHKNLLFVVDPHADLHPLDFDALLRVKSQIEHWVRRYPGRNILSAFVVPDKLQVGVVKLWQAITELYPGVGARAQIFDNETEALAWLQKGGDQPGAA